MNSTVIDDYGIETVYEDAQGVHRRVSKRTLKLIRAAIGEPAGDVLDTIVTRPGRPVPVKGIAELEYGGRLRINRRIPRTCPIGYHTLVRADRGTTRLIVSPGVCHRPSRMWGLLAQLYAARSSASWGIGDLDDLRCLREWARSIGAGFVMVNPLLASTPIPDQDPSPYFPSTRRFHNPIWLSVPQVGPIPDSVDAAGRELNRRQLIDREATWQLKLEVLRDVFDSIDLPTSFQRWRADRGRALEDFATWCALGLKFGLQWRDWPSEYAHPEASGIATFRTGSAEDITFWVWLQWLLDQQLHAGPDDVVLVQDLPIGADPAGADAWCWQDYLATAMSVGAPPDRFNLGGQNWGFPPFVPSALEAAGYQPFIDTVRASMACGGGIRIDHIIGMSRLWWVPEGCSPTEGAYVHYPTDDLLDIICLESSRANAFVVGEDLGTVEVAFRDAMHERSILSSRVIWFDNQPPSRWPAAAMASVGSHDLPTIRGIWTGSELDDQRDSGVQPDVESADFMRKQLAVLTESDNGETDAVTVAVYRRLADAPCLLAGVSLDDAVGAARRPNLPGESNRPNWSYPLPVTLEALREHPLANSIAKLMRDRRTAGDRP